jgi:hypothetical protein
VIMRGWSLPDTPLDAFSATSAFFVSPRLSLGPRLFLCHTRAPRAAATRRIDDSRRVKIFCRRSFQARAILSFLLPVCGRAKPHGLTFLDAQLCW